MLPRWKSAINGFLNAIKEIFPGFFFFFLSQRFILACTEGNQSLIIKQAFLFCFFPQKQYMDFFYFINGSVFGPLGNQLIHQNAYFFQDRKCAHHFLFLCSFPDRKCEELLQPRSF